MLEWLLGKKRRTPDHLALADIVGNLSTILWQLMRADPNMLANKYARVVLRDDWSVGIFCDQREPQDILRKGEVSFVFLQENPSSMQRWVEGLRMAGSNPMFVQAATEEYAKVLVRSLMSGVQVID